MGKPKVFIPEDQPASEEEQQWMAELKEIHGDRLARNSVSDIDLLRFCRAYVNEEEKSPKEKSFETIAAYLQWREDEKVDDLAAVEYERYDEFLQHWPCGFSGIDKSGHPIYYDCIGKMDPSSFSKAFKTEEYVKIHLQMMENLQDIKVELSEKIGRPLYKHTVVIDLDGFGFKHVWDREAMSNMVNIDSTKYPETLNAMLIINAPFVFRAIYAMFSGLLDDSTKAKIHIIKNPKDLLQYIDAAELPKVYGGEKEEIFERQVYVDAVHKRQARQAAKKAAEGEVTTTTTTTTDGPVADGPVADGAATPAAAEEKPAVVEDKPVEEAKPVEDKPVEEAKPAEEKPAPAEEAKPE